MSVGSDMDTVRTRRAVRAYDAHYRLTVDADGVAGWLKREKELLAAIGDAFAAATADRNDPETARLEVGCKAGLDNIRRLCAEGEG